MDSLEIHGSPGHAGAGAALSHMQSAMPAFTEPVLGPVVDKPGAAEMTELKPCPERPQSGR